MHPHIYCLSRLYLQEKWFPEEKRRRYDNGEDIEVNPNQFHNPFQGFHFPFQQGSFKYYENLILAYFTAFILVEGDNKTFNIKSKRKRKNKTIFLENGVYILFHPNSTSLSWNIENGKIFFINGRKRKTLIYLQIQLFLSHWSIKFF